MKKIKVLNRKWSDPNTLARRPDGTCGPAYPVLYEGNIFEKIKHFLGMHFSFGQPFCVVCGKEAVNQDPT